MLDELAVIAVEGGRHFFCTITGHLEAESISYLRRNSIAMLEAATASLAADDDGDMSFDNIYPTDEN